MVLATNLTKCERLNDFPTKVERKQVKDAYFHHCIKKQSWKSQFPSKEGGINLTEL